MKPVIPPHIRRSERGAALLAVLILVAITGAIAASSLEKVRLSRLLAGNVVAIDQARQFALGAEQLGILIVDDLVTQNPTRTTLAGGWNGATRRVPMPGGGAVEARLRDGSNCFNINSVVEGDARTGFNRRPSGVDQFIGLMLLRGASAPDARRIAEAAADWVDSDVAQAAGGAEDGAYAGGAQPYRTGNTLFADVSELRALAGMRADLYARLRPALCALPVSDLSPINVNTILPDQAVLLAMLAPGQLSEEAAGRVLAVRPSTGWDNAGAFWRNEVFTNLLVQADVRQQPQVRTQWFVLDIRSDVGGAEFFETVLVDSRQPSSTVAQRRWEREGDATMAATPVAQAAR